MERKINKSTMKEKTATQIEFDEMVKELYQILKPLGFKKKALHFYRVVGTKPTNDFYSKRRLWQR